MRIEACSRLKINLEKSELISVGDVPNLEELAEVLGCKVGVLPTTYLCLPLGTPYKSFRVWEGVEERFQKRNKVKFWKDRWCRDLPLRDAFLDFFSIASSKDAWVVDVWDGGSWNPRFIRRLNNWELEEIDFFFGKLHDHSLSLDFDDI
ncbi:hypothetical protein CK203_086154 [Vitis vinifera]|uniref:Reverse transcriptase zinc-binding domain-containing protein n=1 Tax=Vitis vinifera TaxID=29760 RepID=A0A438CTA5_VITVI|nr:hypothetical protein CK203_086154 [Vitis vinifera]